MFTPGAVKQNVPKRNSVTNKEKRTTRCRKKTAAELNDKLNYTQLYQLSHKLIPGFNCSLSGTREFENLTDGNVPYPYVVYSSQKPLDTTDPCLVRSKNMSAYVTDLRRHQSLYNYHKAKAPTKFALKKGLYRTLIFSFAELLERNPDPYFFSQYDWYYTGGNLAALDEQNIVIHADTSNLSKLVVSSFRDSDIQLNSLYSTLEQDLEDCANSEIFEIQITNTLPSVLFSVRQKHSTSIFLYDDSQLKSIFKAVQKDVPFISSTNEKNTTHFLTSDFSKTVKLWDFNHSADKPLQTYNLLTETDAKDKNWNCIRHWKANTYIFAGLNNFSLIDSRTSSQNSVSNFEKDIEMCENISCICESNYENLCYFGTTHQIFAVDLRYVKKNMGNEDLVLRWTHQMSFPPIMMQTYQNENVETLAALSPLCEDIRICRNYFDNCTESFTSPELPYMPPSIDDAYNNARTRGVCLDPTVNMKHRVSRCVTGLTFFKNNDEYNILISNSGGNIFAQAIVHTKKFSACDVTNAIRMDGWQNHLISQTENDAQPLKVTNVDDLSDLTKVMRCKRLNPNDKNVTENTLRQWKRQKWQRSVKELYGFKDALASSILSIWDIGIEGTEDQDKVKITAEEESKISQVTKWLDNANENFDESSSPLVSIPRTSILDVSLNTLEEDEPANSQLSRTLPSNKLVNRRKKVKYSMGF